MQSRIKSKEQIITGTLPVPARLWESDNRYRHYLPTNEELLYALSIPATATISKELPGISYKGLYYTCDIPELNQIRYKNQRKRIKINVRYDPRTTDYLYYLDNSNQLHQLPLNNQIPEIMSFAHLSWGQYDKLQKKAKQMDLVNSDSAQAHRISAMSAIESKIKDAAKKHKGITNRTDNIRAARNLEKELFTTTHTLEDRLLKQTDTTDSELSVAITEPKPTPAFQETPAVPKRNISMNEMQEIMMNESLQLMYDEDDEW